MGAMNRARYLLTLLLLFAYTGQSLAAVAVPCFAMGKAGAGQADASAPTMPAMAAHAGHHVDAPAQGIGNDATDTGSSCCEGGLCAMSHCQSAAALLQIAPPTEAMQYTRLYGPSAAVSSPQRTAHPLFRPPIFG